MGESIEQRRGHAFALEDASPLAERQVAGDEDASVFIAVGEDLEQQFRPGSVEADVTQFIHDQSIDLLQHRQHPFEPIVLLRFFELVHQRCGGVELHTLASATRGLTHRDGEMRLAGAADADQREIESLTDPLAARQLQNLLLVQVWREREVKSLQIFECREAGTFDPGRQRVGRLPAR